MKFTKFIFAFVLVCLCGTAFAASDFQNAAQLLSAARSGDIRTVQALVSSGANINYVDNTGLSVVCTALMNNDIRAAQVLQMYGADASRCDVQIRQFNNKLPKGESGGLFSGLSTAQNMVLVAGGAAIVVGGLVLLSGAFDSEGGGGGGGSGGGGQCRPGTTCTCANGTAGLCTGDGTCGSCGSGGGGGGQNPWPLGKLPEGPIASANYNPDFYSPTDTADIRYKDFNYFKTSGIQNYLLMMHGYSPMARGYLGMRTIRKTDKSPFSLSGLSYSGHTPGGGKPVSVALITSDGINPSGSAETGWLVWARCSSGTDQGCTEATADSSTVSSKYWNDIISKVGDDLDQWSVSGEKSGFDLSGHDTVFNDAAADSESALAKIIAGWYADGRTDGDLLGFIPNGQLVVYRTGAGMGMKTASGVVSGTYVDNGDGTFGTGDTLNISSGAYTVTLNASGNGFTASDGTNDYHGYLGEDGLVYIDSDGDGTVDQAYTIDTGNDLLLSKELGQTDVHNWRAMQNAANIQDGGTYLVSAIANSSILPSMRHSDTMTLSDLAAATNSLTDASAKAVVYKNMVDLYYNDAADDATEVNTPGGYANMLLSSMTAASPMLVFSTGEFELGMGPGQSLAVKEAVFENFAPAIYENLNHLFMSVVAVQLTNGTSSFDTVTAYNPSSSNRITLSVWTDDNGTAGDTADDKNYASRVCGLAGLGTSTVDPWCFSAAGANGQAAAAAMSGAVGALKSAFSYMDSKQIFALLALTSDGPYLGTTTDGNALSESELVSYLQGIYSLPSEYQFRVDNGEDYLTVFSEVYGYGLVNLERATKPGTQLYYHDGSKIVSSNGNAFWRSASRTRFGISGAFGSRAATIKAPVYDMLESVDGAMSMPRIWQNEFALGGGEQGLYMGDILGEMKTENTDKTISADDMPIAVKMSFSESNRVDEVMGGLNELSLFYNSGKGQTSAHYQRYFSDAKVKGLTRDEMNNPILSMASRAVSMATVQNFGNFSLTARALSGIVTDETLLENDPATSEMNDPLRLGSIMGAESGARYDTGKLSFGLSAGFARESNTVLGAYSDGLLNMGGGDTIYVDNMISFAPTDNVKLVARATFAKTEANPTGVFIQSMSNIESNAWSFGAEMGGLSFAVSQPLSVRNGSMRYATADYGLVENEAGNYELDSNPYIGNLNLASDLRETRFSGAYRAKLGRFTTGALGFIYRVNPNHTDEFGNESVVLMKINHRLGI